MRRLLARLLKQNRQRPTGSRIGLVMLLLLLLVAQTADAACVAFLGNRREFVGAPSDLFFAARGKAILCVPQVYINFKDANQSGLTTDCGASARISNITGITVQATYCPGICQRGQSAAVDVANSYPPSGPSECPRAQAGSTICKVRYL